MDRGAWWATAHEVTRVRHDLATKSQPPTFPSGLVCQKDIIKKHTLPLFLVKGSWVFRKHCHRVYGVFSDKLRGFPKEQLSHDAFAKNINQTRCPLQG